MPAENIIKRRLKSLRQGAGAKAERNGMKGGSAAASAPATLTEGRDGRALSLQLIDQAHAVITNLNAAPLEYLVAKNFLETRKDPHGYGRLRCTVAMRFREAMAGAAAGGLRGQNLESAGTGFGPRSVSDYALDCMRETSAIRQKLTPDLFRLLELVVVNDVWVWEADSNRRRRLDSLPQPKRSRDRKKLSGMSKELLRRRRNKIILQLHKAIDGAATVFGYINEDEYRKRWCRTKKATAV